MGLKDGVRKMKNNFNEYWPKFKDYALICMISDPRFKLLLLYFLIYLNEKKGQRFFILNYNNYFLKFKTTLQNTTLNQLDSNSEPPDQSATNINKKKKKGFSKVP